MKRLILAIALTLTSTQANFRKQTNEVLSFLDKHEAFVVHSWCRTDKLNCRSIVQYRNKITKQPIYSFEDRFVSSRAHRSVSARAFYLKQRDGLFNVYAQDQMSNQVNIDSVNPENQGIQVLFDEQSHNLPTFEVSFEIIGSVPTQYKKSILSYQEDFAEFSGDINFVLPFHSITYLDE